MKRGLILLVGMIFCSHVSASGLAILKELEAKSSLLKHEATLVNLSLNAKKSGWKLKRESEYRKKSKMKEIETQLAHGNLNQAESLIVEARRQVALQHEDIYYLKILESEVYRERKKWKEQFFACIDVQNLYRAEYDSFQLLNRLLSLNCAIAIHHLAREKDTLSQQDVPLVKAFLTSPFVRKQKKNHEKILKLAFIFFKKSNQELAWRRIKKALLLQRNKKLLVQEKITASIHRPAEIYYEMKAIKESLFSLEKIIEGDGFLNTHQTALFLRKINKQVGGKEDKCIRLYLENSIGIMDRWKSMHSMTVGSFEKVSQARKKTILLNHMDFFKKKSLQQLKALHSYLEEVGRFELLLAGFSHPRLKKDFNRIYKELARRFLFLTTTLFQRRQQQELRLGLNWELEEILRLKKIRRDTFLSQAKLSAIKLMESKKGLELPAIVMQTVEGRLRSQRRNVERDILKSTSYFISRKPLIDPFELYKTQMRILLETFQDMKDLAQKYRKKRKNTYDLDIIAAVRGFWENSEQVLEKIAETSRAIYDHAESHRQQVSQQATRTLKSLQRLEAEKKEILANLTGYFYRCLPKTILKTQKLASQRMSAASAELARRHMGKHSERMARKEEEELLYKLRLRYYKTILGSIRKGTLQ